MNIEEVKKMPIFFVKLIMVLERIANALEKLVEHDEQL